MEDVGGGEGAYPEAQGVDAPEVDDWTADA